MEKLFQMLAEMTPGRALKNEPMSAHTTFKVGGPADVCFFPESEAELISAMRAAKESGAPCLVMGNGSNMIVRDGGIRGLVIILGSGMSRIDINGTHMACQAGAPLAKVSAAAMEASLTGLEFASGIPGTLGGGVAMNAGAYGGELSQVLTCARVLRDGVIMEYSRAEMEMGYRTTRPLREGSIVLSAEFELKNGDRAVISETMRDLNARRRDKQPLNFPSAGSVFKRPEGYFAGVLIEQAGLKGTCVGGAMVSTKHAGFIVNAGGATASDVISLIEMVQERVMERFGVALETEVRIAGED